MNADANISIIARDLSFARFIGARSTSPASSPIAGPARRLPAFMSSSGRAIEFTKKHPRFAYLSPLLKQSKTEACAFRRAPPGATNGRSNIAPMFSPAPQASCP
jgi:hypothetical protein